MYDPLIVDTFVATKDELAESITSSLQVPNNVEGLLKHPIAAISSTTTVPGPPPRAIGQLELQQAIRTVLRAVENDLSTALAVVYLKDRTRDELVTTDALGAHGDELIGSVLSLGTRVSGWVGANGRPILNTDARLEFPNLSPPLEGILCSALPIRSTIEIIGVLLVARKDNQPLASDEVQFLEKICTKFDEQPLRELMARVNTAAALPTKRASVH